MNKNKIITEAQREKIVSSCITLIGRGFSFEYCKIRYKKYEAVPEEYFPVIAGLKKLQRDDLSDDFLKNTLSKIYDESSASNEYFENYENIKIKNSRFWTVLKPAAIFAAAVLLLSFSSIGVLTASQKSLPTNPLYAVKRYSEDFKLFITPESKKNAVHLQFLNNRLEEAELFLSSNYLEKNKMESIIKDAQEEFDYCKKNDYFGNSTEEEIDDKLNSIKEKTSKEFDTEGGSSDSISEKTTGTYNNNENESENTGEFKQDDSGGNEQNTEEKEESADSEIKEGQDSKSEINNDSKTDGTQSTESDSGASTAEDTESNSGTATTENSENNSDPDITQSTDSSSESDITQSTESSSKTGESQDGEDEKESD